MIEQEDIDKMLTILKEIKKEDLKNYAIKCSNLHEKLEVIRRLDNLGFKVQGISNYDRDLIFSYHPMMYCFLVRDDTFKEILDFQQFMDTTKQFLPNRTKLPKYLKCPASENFMDIGDINMTEEREKEVEEVHKITMDGFDNNLFEDCYNRLVLKGKKRIFEKVCEILEAEKKKKQEQFPDFEVDDEGRVLNINNWENLYGRFTFVMSLNPFEDCEISSKNRNIVTNLIRHGLLFATRETRDKALFKLEIEQQLRIIAKRLNGNENIDWSNISQTKYHIYCSHQNGLNNKYFKLSQNGVINLMYDCVFCLSRDFLSEAIKEIGKDKLKQYFLD